MLFVVALEVYCCLASILPLSFQHSFCLIVVSLSDSRDRLRYTKTTSKDTVLIIQLIAAGCF